MPTWNLLTSQNFLEVSSQKVLQIEFASASLQILSKVWNCSHLNFFLPNWCLNNPLTFTLKNHRSKKHLSKSIILEVSRFLVSRNLLLESSNKMFLQNHATKFPNFRFLKIISENRSKTFCPILSLKFPQILFFKNHCRKSLTKSCLKIPQFLFPENYCWKSLTNFLFNFKLEISPIFVLRKLLLKISYKIF